MDNRETVPEYMIIFDRFEHIRSEFVSLYGLVNNLHEEGDQISESTERLKESLKDDQKESRDDKVEELKFRIYQFDEGFGDVKERYNELKDKHNTAIEEAQEEFGGGIPHVKNDLTFNKTIERIDGWIRDIRFSISALERASNEFGEFVSLLQDYTENPDLSIDDLREQRAKLASSIDNAKDLIRELESVDAEVDRQLKILKQREEELGEVFNEVEELKETASHLVKGQAGASIGREFQGRKKELKKSLRIWGAASVISISVLVGSAFFMYMNVINGTLEGITSLSSITLILPISVAVWFSVSNYNRQKRLMNEYEFKSNMALSLMGFREVLKEDIPKDEKVKVGEFIVDTMDKIYTNPYENISESKEQDDPLTPGQRPLVELIRNK